METNLESNAPEIPELVVPKGPQRQKRSADVIGKAITVAKVATGEIEKKTDLQSAAAELGRKGGEARAANLSEKKRSNFAKRAAKAPWSKN